MQTTATGAGVAAPVAGATTTHVALATALAVPAALTWRTRSVWDPTLRPDSCAGEVQVDQAPASRLH